MNAASFDWFLHTMLFIHTQQVIQKQKKRQKDQGHMMQDEEEVESNESSADE